jgi:hypothetical protein
VLSASLDSGESSGSAIGPVQTNCCTLPAVEDCTCGVWLDPSMLVVR